MKKVVVVVAAIVAVLAFAYFYQLSEMGELGFQAIAFGGEDWISNLKSGDPDPKRQYITPIYLNADDMLYERSGNIYAGDGRQRLISGVPLFVNGSTAILNLNDSAKLITEDFSRLDSYYGLLVSGGYSFNADNMTRADPDKFILVRMKSNMFSNVQEMAVQPVSGSVVYIPLNSIIYHTPDSISYYAYEETRDGEGRFVFHRIEGMSEDSLVFFENEFFEYYDYLRKLGLMADPKPAVPLTPSPSPEEIGTEDEAPGAPVAPIEPGGRPERPTVVVTPVPPDDGYYDDPGVAPIEDLPEDGDEGAPPTEEPLPGEEADPPEPPADETGYREPAVSLRKMRVDYNPPQQSSYTASGRLSVIDRSMVLTGDIKIYLTNLNGNPIANKTIALPAGRDEGYVYQSVPFEGLALGATYKVYGEYTFRDRDGVIQTRRFGEQEFTITVPELPTPAPAAPAPSSPSAPIPPGYVKPTVAVTDDITAKIYSLHGSINISDPSQRITGGVTFTVYSSNPGTVDDIKNGTSAKVVRRVYVYQSGEFVIDPLDPGPDLVTGETYWVVGSFDYKDHKEDKVRGYFYETAQFTMHPRSELTQVGVSAAWNTQELYPNRIELKDFGAIPAGAEFSEGELYTERYTKKIAIEFKDTVSSTVKTVTLNDAEKAKVLAGEMDKFLTPTVFEASREYTFEVSFTDPFGVDISEYYTPHPLGGTAKTCKAPPRASISLKVNKVAEFTASIAITNVYEANSKNYVIELYDVGSDGSETPRSTTIVRGGVVEASAESFPLLVNGVAQSFPPPITDAFTDELTYNALPLGKAMRIRIFADYDIADKFDEFGNLEENYAAHTHALIGDLPFVTAPISSLGNLIFTTRNFKLDADGHGARMDMAISDSTDPLLRNLLDEVEIVFTPRIDGVKIENEADQAAKTIKYNFKRGDISPVDFDVWKFGGYQWGAAETYTVWAAGTSYAVGDIVENGGDFYIANTAHTGSAFVSDAANWDAILPWAPSTPYAAGELVSDSGAVYKASAAHTSGTVRDSSAWRIELPGLESKTDYDMTYGAWSVAMAADDGRYELNTTADRYNFKTLKQLPEVKRTGQFVTANTIDVFNLYVDDPDGVCENDVNGSRIQFTVSDEQGRPVYGETIQANTVYDRIALKNLTADTNYIFRFYAMNYNQGYDSYTATSQQEIRNLTYQYATDDFIDTPEEVGGVHYKDAPFTVKTQAGLSGRVYLGGLRNVSGKYTANFYVDLQDIRNEISSQDPVNDGYDKFFLKVYRYDNYADGSREEVLVNPGADPATGMERNWTAALAGKPVTEGIAAWPTSVAGLDAKWSFRVDLVVKIGAFEKVLSQCEFNTDSEMMEIRDMEDFALIYVSGYKTDYSENTNGTSGRFVVTRDLVLDPINYNATDTAMTTYMRALIGNGDTRNYNVHGKPVNNIGDYSGDRTTSWGSDSVMFNGLIDFQGFSLTNNTMRGSLFWRIGQYGEIRNMVYNTNMFSYQGVSDNGRFAYYNEGNIHDVQFNVGQEYPSEHTTYAALTADAGSSPRYTTAATKQYAVDDVVYFSGKTYKALQASGTGSGLDIHLPTELDYWEETVISGQRTSMPAHLFPEYPAWHYYGSIIGRINHGTIERFVVRVNQPVYARERFGFIASSNYGTIRDGYVYASPTMPATYTSPTLADSTQSGVQDFKDTPDGRKYAIQVPIQTSRQLGGTSAAGGYAIGGIAGANAVNGIIENVYSSINILALYDGDVRPDLTQFGTVVGTNAGVVSGGYSTGQVAYRQSKEPWRAATNNVAAWDTTWYDSIDGDYASKAWYFPGVYYAVPPVINDGTAVPVVWSMAAGTPIPAGTSLPNEDKQKNNIAYGPGVGRQTDKLKTNISYYSPDDRNYTAVYNTKVNIETLRAENWQRLSLGSGYNVANTVMLGYYPHVVMDSSMPAQDLVMLPMNQAAEAAVKVTSAIVEQQTDEYAVVALTFQNTDKAVIRDVTFKGDTAGGSPHVQTAVLGPYGTATHSRLTSVGLTAAQFGSRLQIDSGGVSRVWIVVFKPLTPEENLGTQRRRLDNSNDRGAFLSRYTIDSVKYASNTAVPQVSWQTAANQNFTVYAKFSQPIGTLLEWVRYVATDFGGSAIARTQRNYRLTADIDFSVEALKELTSDTATLAKLQNEKILRFNTTTNKNDTNTYTGAIGTIVAAGDIPEFRVGLYSGTTSANQRFAGNIDGLRTQYVSDELVTSMYSLKNIVVDNQAGVTSGGGLFAFVTGKLTNFKVENAQILGRSSQFTGFVSSMYGGVMDNVHLYDETVTFTNPNATYDSFIGGLMGYTRFNEIYNSSVERLTLNSQSSFLYAGGLIGYSYASQMDACYATDIDIKADRAKAGWGIGGLLGYADAGVSQNMYATGVIETADQYVGGAAGRLTPSQTFRSTWNMVNVLTMADKAGGIAGGYTAANPPAVNSIAFGNVMSNWTDFNPNDATAYVHRGAGDGEYKRTAARIPIINAYAWAGQRLNGIEYATENDDMAGLLSVGIGNIVDNDLTDLRNFNTYDRAVKLGYGFSYDGLYNGLTPAQIAAKEPPVDPYLPQVKNTHGDWMPPQPQVPMPGAGSLSARIISSTGTAGLTTGAPLYNLLEGSTIIIEHPEGTTPIGVTITGVDVKTHQDAEYSGPSDVPGMTRSYLIVSANKNEGDFKRYFDKYEITKVKLRLADNSEAEVSASGDAQFVEEMKLEISSAAQWQASFTGDGNHGYTYENIRIIGNIDFNDLYDGVPENGELTKGEMPANNLLLNRLEGDVLDPSALRTISNFATFQNVAQYTFNSLSELNDFFAEYPDLMLANTVVGISGNLYKCSSITANNPIFPDGLGTVDKGTWIKVDNSTNVRDGSGNLGGSLVAVVTASVNDLEFNNFAFATSGKSVGVIGRLAGTGKNLKFRNITIKKANNSEYVGIFGAVNGSIADVYMTKVYVEGFNYVGGLAGYSRNSDFTRIEADGIYVLSFNASVKTVGGAYIGGILGYAYNSHLTYSNAHEIFVYGRYYMGGLAGYLYSARAWGSTMQEGNNIQDVIVSTNSTAIGDAAFGAAVGNGVVNESGAANQSAVSGTTAPAGDKAKLTVAYSDTDNITIVDHALVVGMTYVGGVSGAPASGHVSRGMRVSNSMMFGSRFVGGIVGSSEAVYDGFVRDSIISTIFCNEVAGENIKGYTNWVADYVAYWTGKYGANLQTFSGGAGSTDQLVGGGGNTAFTIAELIKPKSTLDVNNTAQVPSDYNKCIGGVSGRYHTNGTAVINCFVGSDSANEVGGILGRGYTYGTTNHYVINTVVRGRDYVGGYAGYMENAYTVINAINADVKGRNYVGGITGYMDQNEKYYGSRTSYIRGSYFVGTVEATGITLGPTATSGGTTPLPGDTATRPAPGNVYAGGLSASQGAYKVLNDYRYMSNVNLVAAAVKVPVGGNAAFLFHRALGDSSDTAPLPGQDQYVFNGSTLNVGGAVTDTTFSFADMTYVMPKAAVTTAQLEDVSWWAQNMRSATTTNPSIIYFSNGYDTTSGAVTNTNYNYFHYRKAIGDKTNGGTSGAFMPYVTKYGSSVDSSGLRIMTQQMGRGSYTFADVNTYNSLANSTGTGVYSSGYVGGIPIPQGTIGPMSISLMSLSLKAFPQPLPVVTAVYGAGGASELNIEFDSVNLDAGFTVRYERQAPFAQANIENRVYTVEYDFKTAIVVSVSDGERTDEYRIEPDDVARSVLLWGDNYYYTTDYGVREKEGKLLAGKFVNLRGGQGLLASGELYDLETGSIIAGNREYALHETPSPLYTFYYDGYTIDTYNGFSVSKSGGGENIVEMPMIVKNGALAILEPAMPVQLDGLVFDSADGEEYLSFLENGGSIGHTRNEIEFPDKFRNRDIVHMTNNLNTNLPYVLLRYDDWRVYAFNYLTGERVDLNVVDSDMSLLEYAKDYLARPESALGVLADGYLEMKPLLEVMTLHTLTDEMLAAQGQEKGKAGDNETAGENEDKNAEGGAQEDGVAAAGEQGSVVPAAAGEGGAMTGEGTSAGSAYGGGGSLGGGDGTGKDSGVQVNSDTPSREGTGTGAGEAPAGDGTATAAFGETGSGRNEGTAAGGETKEEDGALPEDGEDDGDEESGETGDSEGSKPGNGQPGEDNDDGVGDAAAEAGAPGTESTGAGDAAGETGETGETGEAEDGTQPAIDGIAGGPDGEGAEGALAGGGAEGAGGAAGAESGAAGAGGAGGGANGGGLDRPEAKPARNFVPVYDSVEGQYVFLDVAKLLEGEIAPELIATEENRALAAKLLDNQMVLDSGRARALPQSGVYAIVFVSLAIVVLLIVVFDKRRKTW
jgi:hypothetical protein